MRVHSRRGRVDRRRWEGRGATGAKRQACVWMYVWGVWVCVCAVRTAAEDNSPSPSPLPRFRTLELQVKLHVIVLRVRGAKQVIHLAQLDKLSDPRPTHFRDAMLRPLAHALQRAARAPVPLRSRMARVNTMRKCAWAAATTTTTVLPKALQPNLCLRECGGAQRDCPHQLFHPPHTIYLVPHFTPPASPIPSFPQRASWRRAFCHDQSRECCLRGP